MPDIATILKSRGSSALSNPDALRRLRGDDQSPKNGGRDIVARTGQGSDRTADIYLFDVIGYPFIEAQDVVSAVPPDVQQINMHINSPGGDVFEGLTIYNWLKEHSARVNVRVHGLCASIATIVAMSGSRVSMPAASFFMIHDPWTIMLGSAEDLRKEADLLEQIEDVLTGIYAGKCGKEKNQIRSWMHQETWFSGEQAVEEGFADELVQDDGQRDASVFNLSVLGKGPDNSGSTYKRAAQALEKQNHSTEEAMNEELRKLLEAKGLDKNATEEQAQKFLQDTLQRGDLDSDDQDRIQAQAKKDEKKRQKEIRNACRVSNLGEDFAEELIDQDLTLDQAREKIFAKMEEINPPVGAGRIEPGNTAGEKFRAAAVDGMLMRAGVRVEKPASGARELRGYDLSAIIRESLHQSGFNVGHLNSRRAVADFVFRSRQAGMTTSDFPEIFKDVMHKSLLQAYLEYPATWRPFVTTTTASDFKDQYGISLSNAPDLKLVNEAGEYQYGTLKEQQENYRLYKYGRMLQLTWEMIINDDMRAFTRFPRLMGAAARRKESDLVYNLITSNPEMSDGNDLFHSNHGNLRSSGAHVSQSELQEMRKLMRKQTGLHKERIDVRPVFLLVPVEQETDGEVVLRSRGSTDNDKNSAVINPFYDSLQPIAEPRLDDDSSDKWYVIADPSMIDTIEVATLEGYEGPTIDEREEFTNDAITWKVRHVFGCGVMDWRGFARNNGA